MQFFDKLIETSWILLFIILPVWGYAEIHYRLPFWKGLLFKNEPEIIFDLPHRATIGHDIPLFLFIKDAHNFPIELLKYEIEINKPNGKTVKLGFDENIKVQDKFFEKVFSLSNEHFSEQGNFGISAKCYYKSGKDFKTAIQDNYKRIKYLPFTIYISEDPLPCEKNWIWGDLHIHSNYTDDQVEFGAPIKSTVLAAKTIGLNYVAITDHSYDLDDEVDNYSKNSRGLEKWLNYNEEVQKIQNSLSNFIVIPGEEVSCGNYKNKNIHCLILKDEKFHQGAGDSGEKIFKNKPTSTLSNLIQNKSSKSLAIAAHPAEKPPFSQRIILRRGIWEVKDFLFNEINALQIVNRSDYESVRSGLVLWKELLLQGKKIGIVAGNDAHGNFNLFRQVGIPLLSMNQNSNHLLGEAKTCILVEKFSLNALLNGLRSHRVIVSTGPYANISIIGSAKGEIGSTIKKSKIGRIKIKFLSTPEFGLWNSAFIYFGSYQKKIEGKKSIQITKEKYQFTTELPFEQNKVDYIRLEAFSNRNNKKYFCLTNPIWLMDG